MLNRLFSAFFVAALLVGCGGGGDSAPAANGGAGSGGGSTFALDTFQSNFGAVARSFTATAANGADTYTLFLSSTPASDALFEGAVRKRATQTLTIRRNGVTISASTFDNFYQIGPWQAVGATYSDGTYAVATTPNPALPNAATVGSTGSLGVLTLYTDSTRRSVVLRQEATWTLEADTATTAFYCVSTIARNPSGALVATTTGCTKYDNSGNPIGIRFTIAVDGLTLTFR
jgi:hypothetical protein